MAGNMGRQFTPYITPERRHEVEAHMPGVYVGSRQYPAPTRHGEPGSLSKPGREQMITAHKIARTIMKSDLPAEHLEGLTAIRTGSRMSPGTRMQYAAFVDKPTGYIETGHQFNPKHKLSRSERDVRQRDLVHEIGHHQDPWSHEPGRSGSAIEARAENFADAYKGATKTHVPAIYDDPENMALSQEQKKTYSRVRQSGAMPAGRGSRI
jgi:hypothetical protein